MTAISSVTSVVLAHDTRITTGADSGQVAALSAEGVASLISPDFKTIRSFAIPQEPQGAGLSADGSVLAVAAPGGITLLSTSTFEKMHQLNDAFLGCLYAGEKLFWTCARLDQESVLLEAWEPGSWTKVARARVADPYGNSEFSLLRHPEENSVVVWAAAGQDGQCLFWSTLKGGGIHVSRFELLDETGLPSFSPNGSEFLVTSECALHRYAYPQGPLKGSLTELDGDEDDPIGYFVSYVDAGQALLTSMEGRLFLVDVEEMEVTEEVAVADVGPRDALDYFLPLIGGKVVLVYRERGGQQKNSRLHLVGRVEAC